VISKHLSVTKNTTYIFPELQKIQRKTGSAQQKMHRACCRYVGYREVMITHYALGQLTRGKDVSTDVLRKLCETLDCSIDDIMEFVPEKEVETV